MAYVIRKFDQTSGLQGGLATQMNQYFRTNPYLTVVQAQIQRQENREGGQNYSAVLVMTSNGQRMFAAEFISNQGAFAWAQMNAFFNSNQSVIPYQVMDTTSPDKLASGKTRLLVIYSALGEVPCGGGLGVAFSQGAITAGSVGQSERIGVTGNTLELAVVKNIGDATWPTGARGLLLRSRLDCSWGGIGKRTYGGGIPPFSATTTYPALPAVTPCCGATLPPVVTITPVTNTSSTTATSTGVTSSTTTSSTTTSSTSTPPTVTTATTTPPTTAPGTTNPVPPAAPPTGTPSYTAPVNGYCYSEYASYYNCATASWGAPIFVQTTCAAALPTPINTWVAQGGCYARAYFSTQTGAGDFNCQVGGP
jgi:hypothetical protein